MNVSYIYFNLSDDPSYYQMKEIIISKCLCNNKQVWDILEKAYEHGRALNILVDMNWCWWVDLFAILFSENVFVYSIGNVRLIKAV